MIERDTYRNGIDIGMKFCGCDGCSPSVVNGTLCHELGCAHAWKDRAAECDTCGCEFFCAEKNDSVCSDCAAAADPWTIPSGIEVFYRTKKENRADGWTDSDGEPLGAGWFWWSCFPGCLPDSDPFGPFDSELEAIEDSKGY